MHQTSCPYCESRQLYSKGTYLSRVKGRRLKRYQCRSCNRSFSYQTTHITYRQHRPDLNAQINRCLCAGVSRRKTAWLLGCSKNTVDLKYAWLARLAEKALAHAKYNSRTIQFDEHFSIEHTKLKPLSIAMAVNEKYEILGVVVGRVPASGKIAAASFRKYGHRESEKIHILNELMNLTKTRVPFPERIISDQDPQYRGIVKSHFPGIEHEQKNSALQIAKDKELLFEKNQRAFDVMFALNQRAAKIRSDVKMMARRTYCTPKTVLGLQRHLLIYQAMNNGIDILKVRREGGFSPLKGGS